MIVIISCGQQKRPERSRAKDLYTGPYFRAALAYAEAVTAANRIFILSAKYGLIETDKWINPYELRMGAPGSVSVEHVRKQSHMLGLLPVEDLITVIAGKTYQEFLLEVFGQGLLLPCTGGMGQQIKFLREEAERITSKKGIAIRNE